MRRLRTFGAIAVECDGVPILVAAQRRPLAVLALVACAGPGGIGRDRVQALLWPDHDDEQGRNALRQVVFRIRRDLGSADAIAGTTHLRLNPEVIASDVAEFDAALEAGALERAVALYRGPFLDGFRLPGAPEFERWVDTQRAACLERVARAVERLATDADRRGDGAAMGWWRRLAALEPLAAAPAVGLMRSLIAAGDRAGALAHARLHRTLLRQELGIEPDPAVEALATEARAPADPPTSPRDEAVRVVAPEMPPEAAPRDERPIARPDGRARTRALLATLAAVVVLAAIWGRSMGARSMKPGTRASPSLIAVLPFTAQGDAADRRVGVVASDLLASAIDGTGDIRTADPYAVRAALDGAVGSAVDLALAGRTAERVGAGRFVLGSVLVADGRLVLTAALYVLQSGGAGYRRGPEVRTECDRAHVSEAVDRLAIALLAATVDGGTGRLTAAALGTRSVSAFKLFLAGEADFRKGRYGPALDAYQRAVQEDTAFALAYYRLAVDADWASRADLVVWGTRQAMRYADRLGDHDRALLDGLVAWHAGDARAAEAEYRNVVMRYPDDAEAWYQLGEVQFHLSPAYGSSVLDAWPAFAHVLALHPDDREATIHLQRLAARARDAKAVDSLTARLLARSPGGDSALVVATRAFATRDTVLRARAFVMLEQAPDEIVLHAAIKTAVYVGDLAAARQIARILEENVRGRGYQLSGTLYGGYLEMAMGRRQRALVAMSLADRELGVSTVAARAVLAALPFVPAARPEIAAWRDSVRRWPGRPGGRVDGIAAPWPLLDPRFRPWVLGLLDVRLGALAEAARQATDLERAGVDPAERAMSHDLAQVLRAEVARARGDLPAALALVVSETRPLPGMGTFGSLPGGRVHQRFLRAEILAELGQDDEALRWFSSIGDLSVPEQAYRAPAELRQGEIYERRGDRRRAIDHYRRVAALWRDADPELQPVVQRVACRIARLSADLAGRAPTPARPTTTSGCP